MTSAQGRVAAKGGVAVAGGCGGGENKQQGSAHGKGPCSSETDQRRFSFSFRTYCRLINISSHHVSPCHARIAKGTVDLRNKWALLSN